MDVSEGSAARMAVDEAGVVTALLDDSGADSLPTGSPSVLCAEDVPEVFDVELEAGTYHLQLESDEARELWLLLFPTGDLHDDHEH